jgi:MFS family permease
VVPLLSDRSRRRKPFILGGMAIAVPGLLAFTFFHSYPLLIVAVLWLGFFMLGIAPIGYQYAAEITVPAPEGTSNGLLMFGGQLSVLFIVGMGLTNDWLHSFTPSLLLGVVLMLANCGLIVLMKESRPGGDGA